MNGKQSRPLHVVILTALVACMIFPAWVVLPARAAALSTPAITLTPASGVTPFSSPIGVAGVNFAITSPITITTTTAQGTTTQAATTQTDQSGGFTKAFSPSLTATGPYTITAPDGANDAASSIFTVLPAPTLTVAPSPAQPNTVVSITGSNYPMTDTITILLDGATLCGGSTDALGNLSTTSTCMIPTTLPMGSYAVTARDSTVGQLAATTLSVISVLNVTGSSVTAGAQVSFNGYGFPANDPVNIAIDGYFVCTLQSNAAGQLPATNCFVSAGIPGGLTSYQVVASDAARGLLATATLTPSVTISTLTLSPTSGAVGSQVAAFATGFNAGESVALYVAGAYVTATTADGFGDVNLSFVYPSATTTGLQTVTLSGLTSGHQASGIFDVTSVVSVSAGLTLSPTSGSVGTTVMASGFAYGTGQSVVINFGGTQVATAMTDATGYFSTTFAVPTGQSGVVSVTAVEAAYNYTVSQAFSVIAPQITLGATTAAPGASLTIDGTGFIAGEGVTITLPGGAASTATADASGNFSATVIVPAGLSSGAATISATGASSQITVSATLTITAATLTANPASVNAGSQVTITGAGFTPGEWVLITNPDGSTETMNADAQGNVSVTITIAATQASGTATVAAQGLTSKAVASATITVAAAPPTATATPTAASTTTPLPTATATTTTVPSANTNSDTWYFASGRTDGGYSEQIDVLNPNSGAAQGTIVFYYGSGQNKTHSFSLPALARGTYDAGSIIGGQAGVAVVVHASLPVAATAMGGHGATNKTALSNVTAPAKQWYFAEGYTGQTFKETLDLFNPGATAARVQVTWPVAGGQAAHLTVAVAARSRQSIAVNNYVKRASHATIVDSDRPMVASRTLTFGSKGQGSAATQGTTTAGTTLYLAEGSTSNGFQEYLSILNPGSGNANVTVAFYGGSGSSIAARQLTVAAGQRASILVNDLTHASSVSAIIQSSAPVVAERTMYKGSPNSDTGGGTDAVATASPASGWAFASGDTGASPKEFEILFNPSSTATTIAATWYSGTGQLVQQGFSLAAHARKTIDVTQIATALPSGAHGLVLQSTGGATFVAEQALYDSTLRQGAAVLGAPLAAAP